MQLKFPITLRRDVTRTDDFVFVKYSKYFTLQNIKAWPFFFLATLVWVKAVSNIEFYIVKRSFFWVLISMMNVLLYTLCSFCLLLQAAWQWSKGRTYVKAQMTDSLGPHKRSQWRWMGWLLDMRDGSSDQELWSRLLKEIPLCCWYYVI